MYFNRFDICEAFYIFAQEYHRGFGSRQYWYMQRLEKIKFKARDSLRSADDLEENAREIYNNLVNNL